MGPAPPPRTEPYAWYMLAVLVLVYVFNFVDRQLLAILAPALKRDLGISDSDFGFLYGTAFGVFYALFGIPLGKLADRWLRVRLLALGLALWSVMTALSGLSRNFAQLALARTGVAVGEATLTPCTYSLLSDLFPPRRRATALGLFSAGLYIGSGLSLFLGSSIAEAWDSRWHGAPPLDLAGWQVAFMALGIPGVLVALWLSTLREPERGRLDGDARASRPEAPPSGSAFLRDVAAILPPFTIIDAASAGKRHLAANLAAGALVCLGMWGMVVWLGDRAQWIAFGLGAYASLSWLLALRRTDPAAFTALFRDRAFVGVSIAYALVSLVGYANIAFAPLYAIQELGARSTDAGFMLGGLGALAGSLGVVGGGMAADALAADGRHERRVALMAFTGGAMMVLHALMFTSSSLAAYYPVVFATMIVMSATLAGASGTIVNIVPPHLRGTATAAFLLATNMIGLALGPYCAGKLSTATGDLGMGLLALLAVLPPMLFTLIVAQRALARRR